MAAIYSSWRFQNFTSALVPLASSYLWIIVAFAFMFPNAELALMFIPVPIKAKYFVPV
jgi:hypothetical protein